VIPEKDFDAAAATPRLVLEPHQQIQHAPDTGPAIEAVAGLNEDRGVASPMLVRVHETRRLQDADEFVRSAVNVTNRDNAAIILVWCEGRPQRTGADGKQSQKGNDRTKEKCVGHGKTDDIASF
jgi:hypothetical protein